MTTQEAIEEIRDSMCCDYSITGCDYCDISSCSNKDAFIMAIEALEEKHRWIPVSERLPKPRQFSDSTSKKEYYLVQKVNGKMEVAEYLIVYDVAWFLSDSQECKDVIAWMPLPEPYKGE